MTDQNITEKYGFPLRPDAVWMPVRTIPLNEQRVLTWLEGRGIPCYLPLVRKIRMQNVTRRGRQYTYKREIMKPMFPSYVFACLAMTDRYPLWNTRSVLKILTITPENQNRFLDELHGVKMMEALAMESELEFAPEIHAGDRFLIESGPWIGVYGRLQKKDKITRWSVCLEILGTEVSAVIDPSKYKFRKLD